MRLTGAILLTLLLAALAGAGGAWMGARYVYQKHHAAHSLHELVHEKLDLTPEQERRLDALEQDFAVRRRAREAEMRAANAQLAAAIQARHEYTTEVQLAVDRFHHAMGELQKESVQHVLAMRSVLRPDQAVEFDRQISEALTHHAP
jgi:Spy/CpxP family protein refolding chaperone